MHITYPVARLIASIAEAQASAIRVPMSIAVADEQGGPLYFGRMDGALPASIELSVSKAFTAAALRMPTHQVADLAQPGGMIFGIQSTHQGRIVTFGGGFPLRLGGMVRGAIGISGGTVEEDVRVGEAAVTALEQMENWSRVIRGGIPNLRLKTGIGVRLERILPEVLARMDMRLSTRDLKGILGAVYLASQDETP